MKKVKVGIFDTHYCLLVFLLLFNFKDIKIIRGDNLNLKIGKKIINLRTKIKFNFPKKDLIIKLFENLYLKILFLGKKLEIYGQDHIRLGNNLVSMGDFYLIEDGIYNYLDFTNKQTNKHPKDILKKIIGVNPILGRHQNVKKIYLTGMFPIPKEIAHKVEIINLKELWNKKTFEEQVEILKIFSFDLETKEKIKEKTIILFTQPLSEDNVITEKEKIELYFKIVKKYPKENLIIKTHPREKTDYKNIFKEYVILDNPFPFELLSLIDVKLTKAVTLFSTAALGLDESIQVDFYGTEIHQNILNKFGSCKEIHPTTAKL